MMSEDPKHSDFREHVRKSWFALSRKQRDRFLSELVIISMPIAVNWVDHLSEKSGLTETVGHPARLRQFVLAFGKVGFALNRRANLDESVWTDEWTNAIRRSSENLHGTATDIASSSSSASVGVSGYPYASAFAYASTYAASEKAYAAFSASASAVADAAAAAADAIAYGSDLNDYSALKVIRRRVGSSILSFLETLLKGAENPRLISFLPEGVLTKMIESYERWYHLCNRLRLPILSEVHKAYCKGRALEPYILNFFEDSENIPQLTISAEEYGFVLHLLAERAEWKNPLLFDGLFPLEGELRDRFMELSQDAEDLADSRPHPLWRNWLVASSRSVEEQLTAES